MPDVELVCVQCQSNFVFSESDQETFYRRNQPPPQRCNKCRPKRKKLGAAALNPDAKSRYEIICDNCGKRISCRSRLKQGEISYADIVMRLVNHARLVLLKVKSPDFLVNFAAANPLPRIR